MAQGSKFSTKCPLFDYQRDGGVVHPFRMVNVGPAVAPLEYINLDGTVGSTGHVFSFVTIEEMRLVSIQLYGCADDQGLKAAAATAEPVCVLRRNPTTSIATGSLLATITCDGAEAFGTIWTPGAGTTATNLAAGDILYCYLSTAAAATTSANQDGGVIPVIHLAALNAP